MNSFFLVFKIDLNIFFSVVLTFAVRFHSQSLNLVLLRERQSALEFARFCFSGFAPQLLFVVVLQQFFLSPLTVFFFCFS